MIQRARLQASDVSLIIPARNAAASLERCLGAIAASREQPLEIIVFDDASTDATAALLRRYPVRVVCSQRRCGPAAARNRAARLARGRILMFVDADVCLHSETLGRAVRVLAENPELSAVFGSYDAAPAAKGFFSRFKNLQHHFTHQISRTDAASFWTACGAMRREAFESMDGFDERWWTIQDLELGMRLKASGHRILLDRGLLATHLKPYTLTSWLRSDILARAIPWSLLLLSRGPLPADLNLRWRDRLSGVLALLTPLTLAAPLGWPARLALLLAGATGLVVLNKPFLSFLRRRNGRWFAVRGAVALAAYYAYSSLSFGMALVLHLAGKRERPFWWPAPPAEGLAGPPPEIGAATRPAPAHHTGRLVRRG